MTTNEYRTSERLKTEYWLYAVFHCLASPELYAVQDPSRLRWQPVVTIEHYTVKPDAVRDASRAD